MTIQLSSDGAVATVTINRPEKLNALSYSMIDQLMRTLDQVEADDAVRAIVLTGAGRHAFSAGADISDLAASIAGGVDQALREIVRPVGQHRHRPATRPCGRAAARRGAAPGRRGGGVVAGVGRWRNQGGRREPSTCRCWARCGHPPSCGVVGQEQDAPRSRESAHLGRAHRGGRGG
ncbi:MAG TPA: enoyl-CoA hydratase/isomerase family protein [Actinomycetes bacterium]|nr:enoyl-CoA hydratase/isomerase family protein [Actinomycetes bacterium]